MSFADVTIPFALQLALVLSGPASAIAPPQARPAAKGEAPRIVARIGDQQITADAFAAFVLDERGTTAAASEALEWLVQQRMVEVEAAHRGISVDEATITARIEDLDRKLRAKPEAKQGIAEYLKSLHLNEAEFRAILGKSILAEKMMAADFGLSAGGDVPPEKQGLWFRDEHRPAVKRDALPPGVAAIVGDKEIRRTDWGIHLFGSFNDEKERDDLWKDFVGTQLLLKRGRELGIEVTAEKIQQEVDERTVLLKQVLDGQGMPTEGVDYLSTVKARGDDPDVLLKSDKLKAEVLLKEITRRMHGKDGFKGYYEARRADFDALFGRKVEVATIFLGASIKKSAKVAHTYAEATHELDQMRERLASDPATLAAAFASQASLHSEDTRSARAGGALGFLGAKELEVLGLPDSLLDEKPGILFGPVNTPKGVHLLLIGQKRDASPFEEIRGEVEKAARRNVLEELQKDVKIERSL